MEDNNPYQAPKMPGMPADNSRLRRIVKISRTVGTVCFCCGLILIIGAAWKLVVIPWGDFRSVEGMTRVDRVILVSQVGFFFAGLGMVVAILAGIFSFLTCRCSSNSHEEIGKQ
jgi:hypothetical protein